VPLENQTVRYLDNFSAGTRGATSAEYFLDAGYAVIFLHRQYSLRPFSRHYTHTKESIFDMLETLPTGEVKGMGGNFLTCSMRLILMELICGLFV
jgi:phosphopantothenate-cysteine ligase